MNENTDSPVLSQEEVSLMSFEPKTSQRFICYTTYEDGKTFLPPFVVRSITRPRCYDNNGKWQWEPMSINCYDPIVPSTTQAFYDYINNKKPFNMKVNLMGPVGDKVEEWEIVNPVITMVDFGSLDWANVGNDKEEYRSKIDHINLVKYYKGAEPLIINALIKYDYAKLKY